MRYQGLQGFRGFQALRGFTLVELMLSLGILALGMLALAAIFPVTARIQQRTYDDMMAKELAVEITSLMLRRGIKAGELEAGGVNSVIQPMSNFALVAAEWTESDRSFPHTIAATRNRRYYWIAFFRENNDDDGKLTICHFPPGNPDSRFTIKIAPAAWQAHQDHGSGAPADEQDYLGPCDSDLESFKVYEMYVVIFRRDGDLPAGHTFPTLSKNAAETFGFEMVLADSGTIVLPTADGIPIAGVWNGGVNAKVLKILRFGNEVIRQ